MKKLFSIGMLLALAAAPMLAARADNDKETDRLENSGMVMEEIMNIPDNIPQDLLDKAECVVVFPSVLKAAFIVGGSYGRGAMVCRSGEHFTGPWGAPSMAALEGGSAGFQTGGRKRWISTGRAGDRFRPADHEPARRHGDFEQQSETRRGYGGSGRTKGP